MGYDKFKEIAISVYDTDDSNNRIACDSWEVNLEEYITYTFLNEYYLLNTRDDDKTDNDVNNNNKFNNENINNNDNNINNDINNEIVNDNNNNENDNNNNNIVDNNKVYAE